MEDFNYNFFIFLIILFVIFVIIVCARRFFTVNDLPETVISVLDKEQEQEKLIKYRNILLIFLVANILSIFIPYGYLSIKAIVGFSAILIAGNILNDISDDIKTFKKDNEINVPNYDFNKQRHEKVKEKKEKIAREIRISKLNK